MTVTVGQTLYVKPLGNLASRRKGFPPMQCVVTKIGRKYYHITSDQGHKFKVPIGSNEFYDNDNNYGGILYTSVKLLEQADTDAEHLKAIREYLNRLDGVNRYGNSDPLPHDLIQQIYDIMSQAGCFV